MKIITLPTGGSREQITVRNKVSNYLFYQPRRADFYDIIMKMNSCKYTYLGGGGGLQVSICITALFNASIIVIPTVHYHNCI